MGSSLQRTKNSAFIAVVLIIVNLLSYFSELRAFLTTLQARFGVTSQTVADLTLILVIGTIFFLLIYLIDLISTRYLKRQLISYKTEPAVVFSSDASGERIHDFQRLRVKAKKSIFVMGVGMTYFSADYSLLEQLLERNISVRLLMIDPSIIVQRLTSRKISGRPIGLTDAHFDSYFKRTGYSSDVRSSLDRLAQFVEKRNQDNPVKGCIELRIYPYFVPLNFTIADEKNDGEILFELAVPFSDHRVRLNFTRKGHGQTYESLVHDAEMLWENAVPVVASKS